MTNGKCFVFLLLPSANWQPSSGTIRPKRKIPPQPRSTNQLGSCQGFSPKFRGCPGGLPTKCKPQLELRVLKLERIVVSKEIDQSGISLVVRNSSSPTSRPVVTTDSGSSAISVARRKRHRSQVMKRARRRLRVVRKILQKTVPENRTQML